MPYLRRYGSIAYLRALYKASSPTGKKHSSSNYPTRHSYQRDHRSYEPQLEPYHSDQNHRHFRQHYEPQERQHYEPYTRQSHINSLPPELKHLIVSDLDPVTSACLGLASKDYYPIHRSHHKKRISLYEQAEGRMPLAMYLKSWAPKNLRLDDKSGRFVRRSGARELDAERSRWERRLRRSKRYAGMDVGRYRW